MLLYLCLLGTLSSVCFPPITRKMKQEVLTGSGHRELVYRLTIGTIRLGKAGHQTPGKLWTTDNSPSPKLNQFYVGNIRKHLELRGWTEVHNDKLPSVLCSADSFKPMQVRGRCQKCIEENTVMPFSFQVEAAAFKMPINVIYHNFLQFEYSLNALLVKHQKKS